MLRDDWTVPTGEGDERGTDFNILIGDQDDRVCCCHDGECNPEGNSAFIIAAHNNILPVLDEMEAAIRERDESLERNEWLTLIAKSLASDAIGFDEADEAIIVEDDEMNWHDESIKLTATFDENGLPIYTPKLMADLKAALATQEAQ